ncbi:MFS transporter [candidate division WOR-3 bacterium]|nr:MFS transporter [candidate division WOR-3 bacterium]
MRRAKFWNILRIKDFSIFTFAQTVSQFGDKLDYIALIALIGLFPKERAPLLLSQMMISITLPVIIFGPVAGILVDRWNKKTVMVVCDILRTLCAIAIPILFIVTGSMYPVFAVVFFMFLCALFFNAARSAIIPNLVARKRILTANAVINFVSRGATFLGMLAGGIVVDWRIWHRVFGIAGWTAAFILDALTFVVSAFLLYIMKVRLPEPSAGLEQLKPRGIFLLVKANLAKMWRELYHALRMIIRERNIGFAMATIFLMVLAGSVVVILVVPTVQQEMAWGTSGVSYLAAIGAIGLVIGAYLMGIFGHHFDLKMLMLVCFILVGGSLVLFPFLGSFWAFAFVCLLCGTAISPVFIGQDTLIHRYADDFIRGRIFSLRDWVLNVLSALGAVIIGVLAAIIGKDYLFVYSGIGIALLAVLGWLVLAHGKSNSIPQGHA